VTTLLLVSGQRRVGAYSCDPSLIAHVEDAIAHAAGYSVTGTGTVLTFQGSSPTDMTYRTVDITVNLAFRSPHDAFMSASMADTVMAGSFPVQSLAANTTVTRVGSLVRFGANGSGVSALPDGVDPDLAAPNPLTLILQQAAADRMTWTATAGQDGCRLHGEAPAELQMPDDQRYLDLVVDTRSAEVRRIHDVYSHPVQAPSSGATRFEPSSGWDVTYAVEWSARPEIILPPMPSESGAPTPSALATSCTPDLRFNLEQILTGSAGYRAVGTG